MRAERKSPRNALLARCNSWLNRALAFDEKTAYRIAEIGSASVAFKLRGSELQLLVVIDDGEITLCSTHNAEPQVVIEGGIADFIAMARTQRDGSALAAGQVSIAGDLAIAQQIQNLIAGASLDWEELLALRFGDVVARQLGRGLRGGVQWTQATHAIIERDLSDYLRYEIRLLPAAEEAEVFIAACATLAQDVERLQARVSRLQAKQGSR